MNRKKFGYICLMAISAVRTAWAQAPADTLREVVVTGVRNDADIRHLPMTVTVVGRERLTENERINVLPTVAEQVPGLFVTSRGVMGYGVSGGAAGGLSLRGLSSGSGQLMVLIDGHPQYNGIYGHSISDSYQTMMTERVEVLRGPASVIYGSNAMGGVLNIVTRRMQTDGVRTSVGLGAGSYGTFQGEVSNRVRRGRFSSTVAGQYSRSDNHRPGMGFEQYGGYARVEYRLSGHWQAYADADVTHFNASHPGTVDAPLLEADQWITRGVVTLAVENHYDRTSGAISVYDNFGRHKLNDGHAPGTAPQTRLFRSRDALAGVSWYQSATLFRGNRLTAGLDYQHIYGHAYYTSRATGEVLDTPNKQSGREWMNEVAGYVNFHQELCNRLTLDAGLRVDHHSVAGTEWIPQGGLVYRPTAHGEIKAMVGKGFRNPSLREMYLYPPSNEELLPERMVNYELSWRQRLLHSRISYGINLYYIHGDNLIQTVDRRNINTGRIENRGVEADVTYAVNRRWTVSTNHSWLHMDHPVVAAPRYKGYIGAGYHGGRWTVAAGLQQVSGLYTEVGTEEHQENFTLLNATVKYRPHQRVALWVKGDNLLAQRYEINRGYPMPKATFMGGVNVDF
ncbi:MAG: TonB-dependent receptor [Clostridium sp.]|nr:TonB-dependent receptor [Clostridium sp.]